MSTYIYKCLGCGLLDAVERRGVLTCSTACRVRAHRNGTAEALRKLARDFKIPPELILQCEAAVALSADIARRLHAGLVEMDDVQPEMCRLFNQLAMRMAREVEAAA